MAVNNIAATFAAARGFPSSSPVAAPAPSPPSTAAALSSTTTAITSAAISASWNPHSSIPLYRRSSFLSVYGPPGPPLLRPARPLRGRPTAAAVAGVTLSYLDATGAVRHVSVRDLSRGRAAVFLSLPGAFLPPASPSSMTAEGLIRRAGEITRRRAGTAVACASVNDVYVMHAWGEKLGAGDVMMVSDPEAELPRTLGLAVNLEGLGLRSQGFCLVAENGVVRGVFVDDHRRHGGGGNGLDEVIDAL